MPRPVPERLRELETDVQHLKFRPAADIRARGRRRARRQLATVTAAGAVAVVTAGVAIGWPQQQQPAPSGSPAVVSPAITCVLTLPVSPAEVQLRVLDGGVPAELLNQTVSRLRARDFTVLAGPADHDPETTTSVRYGPAAIGSATVVRAALHDPSVMRFDPGRTDATIDLVLGSAFTRLATTAELNQNLVAAGEPSAPAECAVPTSGR